MESREGKIIGAFFPTVEGYLPVTDIPKIISFEERWTYLNQKYLSGNNFPHYF